MYEGKIAKMQEIYDLKESNGIIENLQKSIEVHKQEKKELQEALQETEDLELQVTSLKREKDAIFQEKKDNEISMLKLIEDNKNLEQKIKDQNKVIEAMQEGVD